MSTTAGPHVLANGYEVSVICPKGSGDPSRQLIDDVHIFKYRPAPEAKSLAGFAIEFGYSWLWTAWLSLAVWRRRRFDIMQACNPPDTYWLLTRLWRPRGVRSVFDQHDLNPEHFLSRFGEPKDVGHRLQLLDDPALRHSMAKRARARVARVLDWRPQAHTYLGVIDDLSGDGLQEDQPELLGDTESGPGVDDRGRAFVDFTDVHEFERFILERSQP